MKELKIKCISNERDEEKIIFQKQLSSLIKVILQRLLKEDILIEYGYLSSYDESLINFFLVYPGEIDNKELYSIIQNEINHKKKVVLLYISTANQTIQHNRIPSQAQYFIIENAEKNMNAPTVINTLVNCCYSLKEIIEAAKESKNKTSVYVAETTADFEHSRIELISELQDFGYKVLPDERLPDEFEKCKSTIENMLHQADFFIHILGNQYGTLLENGSISKIELQHQLVNSHLQNIPSSHNLQLRYIWISPNYHPVSKEQTLFVENIKHDANQLIHAEIIQAPIERFKSILLDKLLSLNTEQMLDNTQNRKDKKNVYLVCDTQEPSTIAPIVNHLSSKGFQIETSLMSNHHPLESHWEKMKSCDGLLIYYSGTNDRWLKSKLQDIIKAPGYGKVETFKSIGIYSAHTSNIEFIPDNIVHIKQKDSFNAQLMVPFENKLTL